jgi:beta-N-acetylhexosaminidase
VALAGIAIALGLAISLSSTTHGQSAPPTQARAGAHHSAAHRVQGGKTASEPTGAASAQLGRLSARQLAGQRVIYSYQGLTPPASLLARIKAGEAAGVIFFSDNISSRAQIRGVIAQLQRAAKRSPVKKPLLMMTDQEGGQVRRLPGAPDQSEKEIGSSSDPTSAAHHAGRGAGVNLRGVGMNVNLAPVLDVYRTSGNFIDQYGRSYSNRPGVVGRLGSAFIAAQQRTGVAATGKHFPGLGAAAQSQNTDEGPVTLNVSRHQLRTVDERPYGPAIAAGLKLVMVSWAVYPALDPHQPAGLSSKIVRGELRNRLHFGGVTITDALNAGALRDYGGISAKAVRAAHAGMDLMLCPKESVNQGEHALSGLANALRTHRLDSSSFMASVKRVIRLRASLGI